MQPLASQAELECRDKLNRVKAWILTKAPGRTDIELDVDVIASGLVNSVSFTEYVLIIEELSGAEIEINEAIVEKVRTLRGVAENFF
jgi:acyl carrier protein